MVISIFHLYLFSVVCPTASASFNDLVSATPFVVGHRGFGATDDHGDGGDSTLAGPKENSLDAMAAAYDAGARVVEIDVQVTADNVPVLFHDEFFSLSDLTCISSFTIAELEAQGAILPRLEDALQLAKTYALNDAFPVSGFVTIEAKSPTLACDPNDDLSDVVASAIVQAVQANEMTEFTIVEAFSPSILAAIRAQEPNIPVGLAIVGLQLLSIDEFRNLTDLSVLVSNKTDFGLQWVETFPFFRQAWYDSPQEYFGVLGALGAEMAAVELLLLQQAELRVPGSGAFFVGTLLDMGISVWGFTAQNADEWSFLEGLGVEGIYMDDVPLGISLQAPVETSAPSPQPSIKEVMSPTQTDPSTTPVPSPAPSSDSSAAPSLSRRNNSFFVISFLFLSLIFAK